METLIPIDNEILNQRMSVSLTIDGKKTVLRISLRWHEIIGKWMMGVSDSEGNALVRNIPVLTAAGWNAGNLLKQVAYKAIGSAFIVPMVDEPSTENPVKENFNADKEFALYWSDTL